jgi:hypothetical protein
MEINLIEQIQTIDSENSTEATHCIFGFMFDAINTKDFDSINNLITDENIFKLDYIYLLTILNLIYKSRALLPGYTDYFTKAEKICQERMTQRNYDLTFKNFR